MKDPRKVSDGQFKVLDDSRPFSIFFLFLLPPSLSWPHK